MTRRHANIAWHQATSHDRPVAHVELTGHAYAQARARLGLSPGDAERAFRSAVTNGVLRCMRQGSHRWWVASGNRVWVMERDGPGWLAITTFASGRWRVRRERGGRDE